jgi:hypothetical protein
LLTSAPPAVDQKHLSGVGHGSRVERRNRSWWHSGHVGLLIRLVELLIVIAPVAAVVIAAVRTWQRSQRRDEPAPIEPDAAVVASAERSTANQVAQWRTITRILEQHSRTDARWLDYELDYAKLLDFPVMTDLRDPLVAAFHKAKIRADLLRPVKAEDLLDDRESADAYLAAVEDYVTAFDAAEAEAIRRGHTDFSQESRQRIVRARSLMAVASDASATTQEREHAYEVAHRELAGLVVLPSRTRAEIERGITGEIGR